MRYSLEETIDLRKRANALRSHIKSQSDQKFTMMTYKGIGAVFVVRRGDDTESYIVYTKKELDSLPYLEDYRDTCSIDIGQGYSAICICEEPVGP